MTGPQGPLFVGGCPRSGTTITGRLLGAHSDIALIPTEVRFISEAGGLHDALTGRVPVERLLESLRTSFYRTDLERGGSRGLHKVASSREHYDELVERLAAGWSQDPWAAGRRFVSALFDPVARKLGKSRWVEMTPGNVNVVSTLHRLFPDMVLVHAHRDGLDVASSLVAKPWGSSSVLDGLAFWAERLREAEAEARRAPEARIHHSRLEALVLYEREVAYRGLLDAVGAADDEAMRAFFDSEATPANAHIGRWSEKLQGRERRRAVLRYGKLVRKLQEEEVAGAPDALTLLASHLTADSRVSVASGR